MGSVWAQDDGDAGAQADPAPMATAQDDSPEEPQGDIEGELPPSQDPLQPTEGAPEMDHPVGPAHEADGHNPYDLSHNNANDMISAPHEPSIDLAFFTLIVFISVAVLLGMFAWKPIMAGLDAREQSMDGKMKRAEEMYQQAEAQLAEYTRKLSEAQQEIKQMREETLKAAEEKSRQIVQAAQESATAERQRAIREIDAAKGSAINELAQASVNLAVDLAGQIARKELSAEDHANLIRDAVTQFSSSN